MFDTTYTVPTTRCPKCKVIVNRATNVEGFEEPSPDDFSICFTCGTICRYNDDMTLREASNKDLDLLKNDQPDDFSTLLHTQKGIKQFRLILVKEN